MDIKLLQFINGLAEKSTVLDTFFIYLTNYGSILFVFILFIIWFSKKNKLEMRRSVIKNLIELVYFRERPFVNESVSLLIDKSEESTSFLSNHASGHLQLRLHSGGEDRSMDLRRFFSFFTRTFKSVCWGSLSI